MKTFTEILSKDIFKLENILKESSKYFAHRKGEPSKYETLPEHLKLSLNYFVKIVDANNLEKIIDNQIVSFVKAQDFDGVDIALFVKEQFINTIYFHDFGKINENFQLEKMNNFKFSKKKNEIGSKHSILSSHLFLLFNLNKVLKSDFGKREKNFLYYLSFLFVHSIDKHHGSLSKPKNFDVELISKSDLQFYANQFSIFDDVEVEIYFKFLNNSNFENILNVSKGIKESFLTYSLVKLNSSLLTTSDYYSTNEFMSGMVVNNFGIINPELKSKIINNVKEIKYNKELYSNLQVFKNIEIEKLDKRSNKNLNILRQSLSADVISEIRKTESENLFYIEAPTGSGKTNLSLLCLSELLSSKREITKVFYVFPFTTLITQTFNSIKHSLHLTASQIVELHSKAAFNKGNDDGVYGNEKLNFIDSLFVNFPISLISHVSFFDVLTSISKEKIYVLHRLANSIVIIDEMQSYSPTEWDKINYLIKNFSKYFNITFIIMSATLPKISKLLVDDKEEDDFKYLIKQRDKYFANPNFSDRVKVETILSENYSEENLKNIIFQKSEEYSDNNKKTVKTVVEFITKKRASEFYELLVSDEDFFEYEIFLISGTILEPRRREIIKYLKTEIKTKVIVVTTQVIEAGVDIDMDIGFKDKSIIDSEEQIAGRINRNANKTDSKLYVFYSGDAQRVFHSDLRYKLKLEEVEYLRILQKKEFDYFYQLVFDQINNDNRNEFLSGTLSEFTELIKVNDYKGVDNSFELIKSNSLSVFVPLKINVKYFSIDEVEFIENFTKLFDEQIDGSQIWNIYESIIKNRLDDFILQKINLKNISSIMSKFIFSIWRNPSEVNTLLHFGEEKYGFLLLKDYESIYSFEDGLSSNADKDVNFIGF